MPKPHIPKLLIAILLPQCAGGLGALFTRESVAAWYPGLVKPWLTPPSWVFGPVWTVLYLMIGFALYGVLVSGDGHRQRRAATLLFCVHLVVNALWSFLFFGLRDPFVALVDLVILWVMVVWLARLFWQINRAAGLLLMPYGVWVTFALYLNYGIWRMNSF